MRALILFILLFAWVSACAPASHKHRKRYRKAYPDAPLAQKHKRTLKKTSPAKRKKPNAVLSRPVQSSLLPTILNKQDKTLMILIQASKNNSGKTRVDSNKAETIDLPKFYIDRTETTVMSFRLYQPGYDEKPFTGGKDCPTCPVMGINWVQASKYCHWAGKRLPREEEWEAAASGTHPFPWGETFHARLANLFGQEDGHLFAAPVGSFLSGASASGVMDMSGNVWEWVDTKNTQQSDTRVVKGGGWTSNEKQARISFRNSVNLNMKNPTFGFRCAKSLGK
ncbi:MAG: SUMF1/EgtB/PvdO family nonheme iron enzyme [Nitrospinaceae bacterium]|nr:SUMF1/EgtB/PvdO family nonheme iron enzyme [Nitrospinaceae bacterium]MBT5869413.1 SUMF1/EgtB/PvdO family nonheme iron enzyme [Nitrospinaceae bacterium]